MEDSNSDNAHSGDETKEKQPILSTPESKYSYVDTSSSDSDFEYEFTCEVCNKTFSGLKPLRQHEKGARHLKRVRKKEVEKKLFGKLEEDLEENEEENLVQEPFAVCKICKKDFMGPESLQQHLKSRSHHKKMASYKLLKEIQDKEGHINYEKLKQKRKGLKSIKHIPLVVGKTSNHSSQSETAEFSSGNEGACGYSGAPKSSDDSSGDETIAENHEFECLDCKKIFTGVNPWYQHLISKVHEKTLKQKELLDKLRIEGMSLSNESSSGKYLVMEEDDVIFCKLCNVALSGPESARSHLKSKKHTKNLEMKKWRNAMKENRKGTKNSSKLKKRASLEPPIENSSEMNDQAFEQQTTDNKTDHTSDKNPNERFSVRNDEYKSMSDLKESSVIKKDACLETSNDESSERKEDKHADNSIELNNPNESFPSSVFDGPSKETLSKVQTNLKSFQETYI